MDLPVNSDKLKKQRGKKWGERVCKDLARLGGGRYVVVRSYHEVSRALMKILLSPW